MALILKIYLKYTEAEVNKLHETVNNLEVKCQVRCDCSDVFLLEAKLWKNKP